MTCADLDAMCERELETWSMAEKVAALQHVASCRVCLERSREEYMGLHPATQLEVQELAAQDVQRMIAFQANDPEST